jgi:hypothetical protein
MMDEKSLSEERRRRMTTKKSPAGLSQPDFSG